MSKNYDGEEIKVTEEQISFADGQLVDEKASEVFPVMSAVVEEETPVALVEETPVAIVEEVDAPVAVVTEEEVVEPAPVYRTEETVITEPAPVAVEEVHRPVWPWALGALALAGAVTALAWPRPTPVAEPAVVTPKPVAVVSVSPKATATPLPAKVETPKATPSTLPAQVTTLPIPTCTGGELVVAKDTVVRTEGKDSGTEVVTLAANTPITITAEGKDGWFPVTSGDSHGYVPATAVSCYVTVTG